MVGKKRTLPQIRKSVESKVAEDKEYYKTLAVLAKTLAISICETHSQLVSQYPELRQYK